MEPIKLVLWLSTVYVGKVLVQYYLIISYNRLRNTPYVRERQPPSCGRTFMNDSRLRRVKLDVINYAKEHGNRDADHFIGLPLME